MERSIYPEIDDSYEPKAESADTINDYHTNTDIRSSVLLIIGQVVVFPIVGMLIAFLIHYCTKLYILEDDTPLGDTAQGGDECDTPPESITGGPNTPPGSTTGGPGTPPGSTAGGSGSSTAGGPCTPPGSTAGGSGSSTAGGPGTPPSSIAGGRDTPPGSTTGGRDTPPGSITGGTQPQQQQQQQQQNEEDVEVKLSGVTFSLKGTFKDGVIGGRITEQQDEAKILQEEKQKEDNIEIKLSVIVTLSYMFSLYSAIMSLIAVIYAYDPNLQGLNEWYKQLKVIRVVPIILFIEDMIILSLLFSYTIFLTCIRYNKRIVLKFYDRSTVWKHSAYCAIFPGLNLAIHGFDIIVALIDNEVHATSVGVAYVALILINVYTLRALYKAKTVNLLISCCDVSCCNNNGDKFCWQFAVRIFLFFLVSLFITLICSFIVSIYIIIPINSAFDKASSSLRIIYSAAIFGFTVFVTYWLLKKSKKINS